MQQPSILQQGDKIGIVSTARKIPMADLQPGILMLESWGLEVVLGPNLQKENHQFAGTDAERAADMQLMLDDPAIKAIICARGGYGTVRIIDRLDLTAFKQNPKWLIGYSDITVLHNHIHTHCGIETLHATMPINFPADGNSISATDSLKAALMGEALHYKLPDNPLNREGLANAEIVGGNLSILYSLTGTNSDVDTGGKILIIEDLDEYLYHIDRMMWNLKKAGKLDGLAGLIVGGMSDMNDNLVPFGKTADEIIREAIEEYDFPVAFDFPCGHIKDNRAVVIGRKGKLAVSATGVTWQQ